MYQQQQPIYVTTASPQYVMQPSQPQYVSQPVVYTTAQPAPQPYPAYGIPPQGAPVGGPQPGYYQAPPPQAPAPAPAPAPKDDKKSDHDKKKKGKKDKKDKDDKEDKDDSDEDEGKGGSDCCLFACLAAVFIGICAICAGKK